MKYRALGATGLQVPALSFGASSLGSVFREVGEADAVKTVHDAFELGLNYMDVSPYYGLTKAETMLGKAIAGLPRDQLILSTKAGRYGMDEFDFSGARIRTSLEESLQRLGTDYVDILLLHDIEFAPLDVVLEEGLETLNQLKQEGKIRFTGISGLPLDLFRQALAKASCDVILSYCHYALNDNTLLDLVPELEARGIGLINASPLSMGLLGERPVAEWHPASAKIRETCKAAAEYCRKQGVDIAQLAIQYSVSNESIPTTLVSTANPANIRRNAEWAMQQPDEALLKEVLAILEPVHNLTWPSGRPEYNTAIRT